MPRQIFIAHDPTLPVYSPRITQEQWRAHEPLIRARHDLGDTKNEILQHLEREYSFRPSLNQLTKQMAELGLRVYRKAEPAHVVNPIDKNCTDQRTEITQPDSESPAMFCDEHISSSPTATSSSGALLVGTVGHMENRHPVGVNTNADTAMFEMTIDPNDIFEKGQPFRPNDESGSVDGTSWAHSMIAKFWPTVITDKAIFTVLEYEQIYNVARLLVAAHQREAACEFFKVLLRFHRQHTSFPDRTLLRCTYDCAWTCSTKQQVSHVLLALNLAIESCRISGDKFIKNVEVLQFYKGELLKLVDNFDQATTDLEPSAKTSTKFGETPDILQLLWELKYTGFKAESLIPIEQIIDSFELIVTMRSERLDACAPIFLGNLVHFRESNVTFLYCFCVQAWLETNLPISFTFVLHPGEGNLQAVKVSTFEAISVLVSMVFEKAFPKSVFGDTFHHELGSALPSYSRRCIKSIRLWRTYSATFRQAFIESCMARFSAPFGSRSLSDSPPPNMLLRSTVEELLSKKLLSQTYKDSLAEPWWEKVISNSPHTGKGRASQAETISLLSTSSASSSLRAFLGVARRANQSTVSLHSGVSIPISVNSNDSFGRVTGMPSGSTDLEMQDDETVPSQPDRQPIVIEA